MVTVYCLSANIRRLIGVTSNDTGKGAELVSITGNVLLFIDVIGLCICAILIKSVRASDAVRRFRATPRPDLGKKEGKVLR